MLVLDLCKIFNISRSAYYYKPRKRREDKKLEKERAIITCFYRSHKAYGARRIKVDLLRNFDLVVSRKFIREIMIKQGLNSSYTKLKYRNKSEGVNTSNCNNILNRNFTTGIDKRLSNLVSDLTYVKVGNRWSYVCLLIDLYNREIVGHSVGGNKDSNLVYAALCSIKGNLNKVNIFHSDRGKEFDNELLDKALSAFKIQRSLSKKGCPYDNAVIESTMKSLKIEFIYKHNFKDLSELRSKIFNYINWYNNFRIHSSLNNQSPIMFEQSNRS